jgi:hypothetical protein
MLHDTQTGDGGGGDGREPGRGYETGRPGNAESVSDERQADLIMATALARALSEVVERLDSDVCEDSTLAELQRLAERAEAELESAA